MPARKAAQTHTTEEPVRRVGDMSKEEALKKYAPLVKYVVDRIATGLPKTIERDDLVNTAVIGLFDAMEKYDEGRGTKFETYAVWRIRGAVLDELRSLDWVSRSVRKKAKEVEQTARRLDQQLGRAASDHEVAKELNLSPGEFNRLLEEVRGSMLLSLDQAFSVDDDHDISGLADMIEDEKAADVLDEDCGAVLPAGAASSRLAGAVSGLLRIGPVGREAARRKAEDHTLESHLSAVEGVYARVMEEESRRDG